MKKNLLYCIAVILWLGAMALPWVLVSGIGKNTPVTPPVSETVAARSKPGVIQGTPVHISIPKLSIDVSIAGGEFNPDSKSWTLSDDKAHYALTSVPVNTQHGSTFIYGHNSQQVFGNLQDVSAGVQAIVTTDNGYKFTYEYKSSDILSPGDVDALLYEGKPRIMLQTCTGIWNEKRQMSYFYMKSYEKID